MLKLPGSVSTLMRSWKPICCFQPSRLCVTIISANLPAHTIRTTSQLHSVQTRAWLLCPFSIIIGWSSLLCCFHIFLHLPFPASFLFKKISHLLLLASVSSFFFFHYVFAAYFQKTFRTLTTSVLIASRANYYSKLRFFSTCKHTISNIRKRRQHSQITVNYF